MHREVRFNQDVGVVVTGGVTHIGGGTESLPPPVYIDEEQFYKYTKMRASAPARVALMELLREDITHKALARVWRDELEFSEGQFTVRVDKWVPMFTGLSLMGLAACFLATLMLTKTGQPLAVLLLFASACLGTTFVWSLFNHYIPFMVAKRVAPLVAQVNVGLPQILDDWKRGGRR